MVNDMQDRSADYKRYRRVGHRLDSWALASDSSIAKHIYAAIASNGTSTFGDLITSVEEGTLEGWEVLWVGQLARIIALQPHEHELHPFAQRALSLAVEKLPQTPSTLSLRKLRLELLVKQEQFARAAEVLNADTELAGLYHGYLRTDVLNPFALGREDTFQEWLAGFNRPFTDAGLSPVSVDGAASTPFDGLRATVAPATEDGPLVTVIVTTFNPVPTEIRTAVNSILRQTWRNLEVLLVDDHSSEGSVGTLEELAAEDPRIRLIRLPVNGGTYRARNVGIREANGKYMTGQDTDDWSHPERIAMQVALMEESPHLAGVTTAANRTNDLLVKMAPGHSPHRKCEVSLMLRVKDARAIGGYLPVRKAADSEFRERLETWSGTPTQLIDVPLYVIRMSVGSLSRTDFRPGWSHAARRAFWSSYKHWHRNTPPEALAIDATSDVAGIPSSAPPKIAGREWEAKRRFDVCIVADWRGDTPQQRAARDELNALVKSDLAVAVLHLDTPWGARIEPRALHPDVQELISSGKIARIFIDQQIDVDLMLVRAPETMDFALRAPGEVNCGSVVLIGHGALAQRAEEVRDYDPTNAHSMAKTIFGVEPRWSLPDGDAAVGVEERFGIAMEELRYPIFIDTASYNGAKWRRPAGAPLVLGCAATNDELSWPEADHLSDVVPLSGEDEVRVLGDARGALRATGQKHLPPNWVQFREYETTATVFWRTVDVAMVLGRGAGGESVERAALEALAAGTLVVMDESRAAAYGGAVVASRPREALDTVRAVLEEPETCERFRRVGKAFAQGKADGSVMERYVRNYLNEARAGAESND